MYFMLKIHIIMFHCDHCVSFSNGTMTAYFVSNKVLSVPFLEGSTKLNIKCCSWGWGWEEVFVFKLS